MLSCKCNVKVFFTICLLTLYILITNMNHWWRIRLMLAIDWGWLLRIWCLHISCRHEHMLILYASVYPITYNAYITVYITVYIRVAEKKNKGVIICGSRMLRRPLWRRTRAGNGWRSSTRDSIVELRGWKRLVNRLGKKKNWRYVSQSFFCAESVCLMLSIRILV